MNDNKTPPKKKASLVRHTRAVQRDRSKRSPMAAPDEQVVARMDEIIRPATLAMVSHFHQQGLPERTLTLPIMMAFVLSLICRQIGRVSELLGLVQIEALLWAEPLKVSQQALSQRSSVLLPTSRLRWCIGASIILPKPMSAARLKI